ncbi:SOS-response transcrptional repressor LexA [Psychroflexus torquis ATCC 700755]|uniref:SOS-response transcrptional repressor LexA n=1 Tax=Psychroflexus torquis (strain ATCC 700755 / CIP 106069 / ACAM 623) TaxID=313595 RepID=K4IIZ5_PSYTT|nr:LexA family transcriptional regulator [Psychroflexus torquis]AFU70507.1 SOS-response transcrptional repressor LexA [Psychroflexus torquis ATCC 700755]
MENKEVKEVRKALKMTQTEFAEKVGVSKITIISYEKGGVIPKSKSKILENMHKEAFENDTSKASLKDYELIKLVPLVASRVQAGFLSGWGDDEYIGELPKIPWEVEKEFKGNYFCFEVEGDSMNNSNPSEAILDKDILLCREIQKHHWKNKLHINSWDFVIAHKDRGIVVKRITDQNVEYGKLALHSLNNLYEDYTVNIEDVIALFNVVAMKRSRRR